MNLGQPKPYTEAEACALIFKTGMTIRDYNQVREGAVERGLPDLYPSYKKTLKYRKAHCRPKGIVSKPDECYVPFQNVLDHQMDGLLKPKIKQKMIEFASQGATFHLYVKYGTVCFLSAVCLQNVQMYVSVLNFDCFQVLMVVLVLVNIDI